MFALLRLGALSTFALPRLTRRLLVVWAAALCCMAAGVRGQGLDVITLGLRQQEGHLTLEFSLRTQLPRSVEDALKRGVPVYFLAQASLYRSRWYWRDERIARVTRQWRVAYQPLTGSWSVGIGVLTQIVPTLEEAMTLITRTSGWRVADLTSLEPGSRHYVEFAFRLDTTQLPAPMLVGLTTQADWQLGVERSLRVE